MDINFEASKRKNDGRLTNEEAIAYQTYAAERSGPGGKGFSEIADKEAYEEAEALLQRIELAGVKLDGIDFEKVDLKDAIGVDKLSERLEKAVLAFEEAKKNNEVFEEIKKASKSSGLKRVIILLNVLSILSGGIAAHAAGEDWKKFVPQSGSNFTSEFNSESHIHQENDNRHEKIEIKKFQMGDVTVSFTYDAQGNPINMDKDTVTEMMSKEQLKQLNEKIETEIGPMLSDDVDNVLENAPFPGYQIINRDKIKRDLKNDCKSILKNTGIHKQLLEIGKKKEAKFLRERISDKIVWKENKIGAKVFNYEYIQNMLDHNEQN